ncbi:PREDICTED: uncharacterized protein LOC104612091 [Nelumbo nucifera]|nr:PREDICTED: uncharacterized protein LOC104612091 [Nelumbo nucifera]
MPILCLRPWATTSEKLQKCEDSGTISSCDEYFYKEPVSPRVGCMGQIKRSNKVVGFPGHSRSNNNNNNGKKKYLKLQKMFSSKDLISTTGSRRQMIVGSSRDKFVDEEDYRSIKMVDLDPPLPVIKRVPNAGGEDSNEVVSLWKRRCGGEALKGLEIQKRQPVSLC